MVEHAEKWQLRCSSVGVMQSFNRAGVRTIGRQECFGCGCFKDVLLHLISQEDVLCFLLCGAIAIFAICKCYLAVLTCISIFWSSAAELQKTLGPTAKYERVKGLQSGSKWSAEGR